MTYIRYISLIDSTTQADQIRVTPNWRGNGPRFDFVILNWDHETKRCAQVIQLLNMSIREQTHALALVRLLGPLTRSSTTGYLHASSTLEYRWVFAKSFIRSVHVHPPGKYHQRYIINDLIDGDFYFRLRDVGRENETSDRDDTVQHNQRDYEGGVEDSEDGDYLDPQEGSESEDDFDEWRCDKAYRILIRYLFAYCMVLSIKAYANTFIYIGI